MRSPAGPSKNRKPEAVLMPKANTSSTKTERSDGSSERVSDTSNVTRASSCGPHDPAPFWESSIARDRVESGWKPDCKIPLARVSYELNERPVLYVLEVKVLAKDGNSEPQEVKSKRLRHDALKSFLKGEPEFDSFAENITIDLDARTKSTSGSDGKHHLINHLIVAFPKGANHDDMFKDFVREYDLTIKKKGSKSEKDRNICCQVQSAERIDDTTPDGKRLYAKSVTMVFRNYLSKGAHSSDTNQPSTSDTGKREYEVDAEYWTKCISLHNSSILQPPKFGFDVSTRCRPTFEWDDERLVLHFDFDLLTVIPADQPVPELLGNYFKSLARSMSSGDETKSPRIKELLRGLSVTHVPPPSQGPVPQKGGHGRAVSQPDNDLIRSPKRIRSKSEKSHVVIRDIKAASEVGRIFDKKAQKYCSVNSILGKAESANGLPLADIGRRHAYWVRLDTLYIDQGQILRQAGHFTSNLKSAVDSSQDGIETEVRNRAYKSLYEAEKTDKASKKIFNIYRLKPPQVQVMTRSNKGPLPASASNRQAPKPLSAPSVSDPLRRPDLTIIHVSPAVGSAASANFLNQIKSSLRQKDQNLFKFADRVSIHSATSVSDLIRQESIIEGPHLINKSPCSDVILAIIDSQGIDSTKYEEIESEIKRFADRKLGAVTVCLEQQNLDSMLKSRPGVASFPPNVLRKINFMLGHENYDTASAFKPPNLMIAGAHISYPDGNSTEFCPSVAAVVTNLQPKQAVYPGSMRLQPNSANKPQRQILELNSMMKERFDAWKGNNPPDVLFYRKAYDIKDQESHKCEIEDIKSAYQEAFSSANPVRLTYIVLSKNTQQHIRSGEDKEAPFTFTIGNKQTSKYQYHVAYNGLGLSSSELAELTADVNSTAQLGGIPSPNSIALPLRYAQKLSRRVFDYFRFWSHKNTDNIPNFAKITPHNWKMLEERDGEHFKTYVQEYLETRTPPSADNKQVDGAYIPFRDDGSKLPWKASLDQTMFYL